MDTRTHGDEPDIPQQRYYIVCKSHGLGMEWIIERKLFHTKSIPLTVPLPTTSQASLNSIVILGKSETKKTDCTTLGHDRYYSSTMYRWTNCDPIGLEDGVDVYIYVHCNAVNMNDPNGKNGKRRGSAPTAFSVLRK